MTELELRDDIRKYEGELEKLQQQLEELDKKRAEIQRVGVRIEGAIAYIRLKLSTLTQSVPESKDAS